MTRWCRTARSSPVRQRMGGWPGRRIKLRIGPAPVCQWAPATLAGLQTLRVTGFPPAGRARRSPACLLAAAAPGSCQQQPGGPHRPGRKWAEHSLTCGCPVGDAASQARKRARHCRRTVSPFPSLRAQQSRLMDCRAAHARTRLSCLGGIFPRSAFSYPCRGLP